MSEIVKLRASQGAPKIARTVNVLPRFAQPQPGRAGGRQSSSEAGSFLLHDQSGVAGETGELQNTLLAEYERGMNEGCRLTEEKMRAEVAADLDAERQRVGKFLARAGDQWSGIYAASEDATVKFAFGVAELILRKEISRDRGIVVEQIKEGMRRVLGVESVKIRVHPQDLPLVREQKSVIQASGDSVREVIVEGDEGLEQGDCIIESDMGNIDARISTQLKQIENFLFESKVVS